MRLFSDYKWNFDYSVIFWNTLNSDAFQPIAANQDMTRGRSARIGEILHPSLTVHAITGRWLNDGIASELWATIMQAHLVLFQAIAANMLPSKPVRSLVQAPYACHSQHS